jgi:hypothetical protein
MRTILLAMATTAGIGFAGVTSISAAPVNGGVIDSAANAGTLIEQVHCKWYPHRHRGGKPHGFGRGCPKKPAAAPAEKKG